MSILAVVNWLALTLVFSLALSAQSITGKIADSTPIGLRNVPVGLLPVGGDWITKSTRTDSNGIFRFSPVEPGEYVVTTRAGGFRNKVQVVHVFSDKETSVGTLELRFFSCDNPGMNCDFGKRPPPRPPVPVVDLCEALKGPDRYGNTLIVVVGTLITLHGWPTLTATCDTTLTSDGLTWTNAVLLPEGATPQRSPTLPKVPALKKKLADLDAAVRKTSGSTTARVAAVYGFLDIPDGLTVVPCIGDSCTRPDIKMPPASFLRVDGFEELK